MSLFFHDRVKLFRAAGLRVQWVRLAIAACPYCLRGLRPVFKVLPVRAPSGDERTIESNVGRVCLECAYATEDEKEYLPSLNSAIAFSEFIEKHKVRSPTRLEWLSERDRLREQLARVEELLAVGDTPYRGQENR